MIVGGAPANFACSAAGLAGTTARVAMAGAVGDDDLGRRALGEFGATIMVAGFIPGQTATLALSIYHLVQLGRDTEALALLGVSVTIAFAAVFASEWFLRRRPS